MPSGADCPCCIERNANLSAFTFLPQNLRPNACSACVLPSPPPLDPTLLPPFTWPTTTSEIEEAIKEVELATNNMFEKIVNVTEPTFENVIEPLMNSPHFKTNHLVCQSKFLQHCSTDEKIREAAEKAGIAFAALKSRGKTRKDVYDVVKAYSNTATAKNLNPYKSHFVQAIVSSFEASGLGLSPSDQAKLQELKDKDTALCTEYKKNLAEDKTELFFTPEELTGMDSTWISDRTQPDGKIKVTLKYPDIIPINSNCEVEETRRLVLHAYQVTAFKNNLDLVASGIQFRKSIATLLGYSTFSAYAVASRMSGTPENIDNFLLPLQEKVAAGAKSDFKRYSELKVEFLKSKGVENPDPEIKAYDTSFYHSLLLKKDYGVDNERIRQYFPLDHVVEVTMEIYQELLGLVFTEVSSFDSWHPEVRLFRVMDKQSDERVGFFYLDLHPREGKYGHAAIFHLLKRWGDQTPVDCMMCNLPPPSSDGKPALLRHGNVVTFFHEFGHIMHGLLSEGDGNSTTFAKCPRDFVEAPSQMLENWCWTKTGLKRLAKHHESGETLPDDLLQSMIAAKNVGVGAAMARQLYLGRLDLTIHGSSPPSDAAGLQDLVDKLRPEISGVPNPPGANMLRCFGHLMNQYASAYYGYMWAEVLSSDMFSEVFEADPFSATSGMKYRKEVLAPGGVGNISDHLKKFLGREPSQEAFLKARGIVGE
ncbi:hypothetical protein TrLO_g7785 [Triparma laevis f. longispina]|uniref:Peptidase M3A/M3B catalytic domain-containing protein n=1 Tax=Triparma laevis f. longispina TaxID=1714387 RepID=A0A9W7FFZ1_9STRA|nr:hypothetical protein TrLO_g7785 [Triparma laevis f. longispina]